MSVVDAAGSRLDCSTVSDLGCPGPASASLASEGSLAYPFRASCQAVHLHSPSSTSTADTTASLRPSARGPLAFTGASEA